MAITTPPDSGRTTLDPFLSAMPGVLNDVQDDGVTYVLPQDEDLH